jgi:cytidyltransferase-like protein
MNLGEQIANFITEQETKTIALYPGAFKPPHRGHFELVKRLSKVADEVLIIISPIAREGITAQQSLKAWDLYLPQLPKAKVVISDKSSPVQYTYDVIKAHPNDHFVVAFGKGENDRFNSLLNKEKYPNVKVYDAGHIEDLSASSLRNAIKENNPELIARYLPFHVTVADYLNALNINLRTEPPFQSVREEGSLIKKGKTPKGQFLKNSGIDMYSMELARGLEEIQDHEIKYWAVYANIYNALAKNPNKNYNILKDKLTGEPLKALDYFYNTYFKEGQPLLKENTISDEMTFEEGLDSLIKYFIDKGYQIEPLPSLVIKDNDVVNAAQLLGKTAYYDPNKKEITLFTLGRHPKDILRSFSHEMIHHIQNLRGDIGNIETTNTNANSDLDKLEEEAYLKGNIIFRNWEDSIKHDKTN